MKKLILFSILIIALIAAGCGRSEEAPVETPQAPSQAAEIETEPLTEEAEEEETISEPESESESEIESEPESESASEGEGESEDETAEEAESEQTSEEETTSAPKSVRIGDVKIKARAKKADISYIQVKSLGIDMDEVLDSLPNLKKINMIGCGLTNEEYAKLQDNHPNVKIIWEVDLYYWKVRTDAVAFSTLKTCSDSRWLDKDTAQYLRYCTDMVALDLGHNGVYDISFLKYMPNLKILIMVDNSNGYDANGRINYISDFSVLKYCTKLRYLEIFCTNVSDLRFLKYCKEIEDLNISYTGVSSIKYLKKLPKLKRLWMEHTGVSYDDFLKLQKIYPDVEMVYYGTGSVDQGWRDGDRYWAMRDMVLNNRIHEIYAD